MKLSVNNILFAILFAYSLNLYSINTENVSFCKNENLNWGC